MTACICTLHSPQRHDGSLTSVIGSTPPNICALDFPARAQIQFMYNHHLLQILRKPPWLTIKGGRYRRVSPNNTHFLLTFRCSKQYVERIVNKLPHGRLHLSTPIKALDHTESGKVLLTTGAGEELEFDHVILACHSDTSLKILGEGATEMEKKVLSAFGWAKNEVVLHNDLSVSIFDCCSARRWSDLVLS